MRLSRNFRLDEFIDTSTGLYNIPTQRQVRNLYYLTGRMLQPLRDYVGRPVIVTSGYRSESVNEAVGGVAYSQHKAGEAADLVVAGYTSAELIHIIRDVLGLPFDQLIDERKGETTWLHASLKAQGRLNRREVLTISV